MIKKGSIIVKTEGDYTFEGIVVEIFHKWPMEKYVEPPVRLLVQDARGLLLIMNPKQVIEVPSGEDYNRIRRYFA